MTVDTSISTTVPPLGMTTAKIKLTGRELFDKIGKPSKIVAPMVDQSELAWRILSRRYGATLCYTPMLHLRLFATDPKYKDRMWLDDMDGNTKFDRPLVAQFCANDADYLLQAARKIEHQVDAVDLNLGCPQGIAKKGNYGAFLMDDWDLVYKLIKHLHENLNVPVTLKIRVYEDWDKSLQYAKLCLEAGAQFITIHGRTREMKGQKTGLANWGVLKYLKENLPLGTVFFSNGNILYAEDVARCMDEVGSDGVMSAEGNLYNPGVFWTDSNDIEKQYPRVDKLTREYFEILQKYPTQASRHGFKNHLFKYLRYFLPNHTEVRTKIATLHSNAEFDKFEEIVKDIETIVQKIYEKPDIKELDVIIEGPKQPWGGAYKTIPYWRCQPCFRTINGVNGKDLLNDSLLKIEANIEQNSNKRKLADVTEQDLMIGSTTKKSKQE